MGNVGVLEVSSVLCVDRVSRVEAACQDSFLLTQIFQPELSESFPLSERLSGRSGL